ncbi:MAG: SMC-Scp complex subunit ScpB [Candidatus Bipolaricaulaceae bacterium]
MIPKALVEAALFLSDRPLSVAELAQKLGLEEHVVLRVLARLADELEEPERGLELAQEGGGYVLRVKAELVERVRVFAPDQDLSEQTLRTLAVIVAKAPVAQAEVVKLRGQRAYGHIKELLSRGFIRAEDRGTTKILDVTEELLRYFGVGSLGELRALLQPSPIDGGRGIG